ncbi:MAG: glycosyltransferase family A protein [Pseudodesulfovibrio sp.]
MTRPFDFPSLPADLLRPLLMGFSGRLHLHAVAQRALARSAGPGDALAAVAGDALLAAWGENPLDGNCAAAVAGNLNRTPPPPPLLLPTLKAVLAHWHPEVTDEARQALAGDIAEQRTFLLERVAHGPGNLFWWHHLYEFCRISGDWKPLADLAGRESPIPSLAPLFRFVAADALLASGDARGALALFERCVLPLPILRERTATALHRLGESGKAQAVLREAAGTRPWNAGLTLRLFDLQRENDRALQSPEGRTAVLAYSWNKADDLAATLDSLLASDLDDVVVRVLDNGSDDATPEVIRRFADRFGTGRAAVVRLPVNVGAPAARNWLMHLPEVREARWAAFIDDDIHLPPDWLRRLGAAVARYPEAGVWGCKVVDARGPARVQCGEHNLTADPAEREATPMSTIMLQDGDFGQADYIRPCASVTGCVHLFCTSRLLENGPFDLRFSPTQFDDLERDLRMVLHGGYAVYTGFLTIPHKRSSGSLGDAGRPGSADASANLRKLWAKYAPEEFEAMARSMDAVLLADLLAKGSALD